MSNIKKIAIYPLQSSGHINACVSIAKLLLNKYSDQLEIVFITDNRYKEKISRLDERFVFRTFEYDDEQQEGHIQEFIKALETIIRLPLPQRMGCIWGKFEKEKAKSLAIDRKVGDILCEYKPDLILMDQLILLPSVIRAKCPYSFIVSANPLAIDLSPSYPHVGSDAGIDETDKIAQFREILSPFKENMIKSARDNFKLMDVELDDDIVVHKQLSKYFTIYCFPSEIDYYTDEIKKANTLISFDTPLIQKPPPFVMPEHFAKKPGKIVYLSLGSMFSMYYQLVQKLINMLATLPNYKFIVSKGPRAEHITFPNDNFIGEPYVDQLAVLQIADIMISHGGNNSICECFYFGVPIIIMPVFFDQINNAKRIEEKGYGVQLSIFDVTEQQLKDAIEKLLNDQTIKSKWKAASERIQKEQNHNAVADYVYDFVVKN